MESCAAISGLQKLIWSFEPLEVVREVHGKARKCSISSCSSCIDLSWTTVQALDSEAEQELRLRGFRFWSLITRGMLHERYE